MTSVLELGWLPRKYGFLPRSWGLLFATPRLKGTGCVWVSPSPLTPALHLLGVLTSSNMH